MTEPNEDFLHLGFVRATNRAVSRQQKQKVADDPNSFIKIVADSILCAKNYCKGKGATDAEIEDFDQMLKSYPYPYPTAWDFTVMEMGKGRSLSDIKSSFATDFTAALFVAPLLNNSEYEEGLALESFLHSVITECLIKHGLTVVDETIIRHSVYEIIDGLESSEDSLD